ncbi:glycosyltransferase [Segetibacter aerophilus]|uniref:Glycosyl transferase n=1 Tax=Segetibacter aerophilus TaxID=670293 RepID=A0A512B6M3_9BACT|nr:glycosyltransferase [Segetibacter aerophilus]GEO07622.1 glycosyl transferase [Segetibacter aerophilus]
MSNAMPLVTIAIPFFNPGSYVIETLDSVYNQSYSNIQLILYNDGSTDNSLGLIHKWLEHKNDRFKNLVVIDEKVNKGVGYGCDIMFRRSSGIYFQMLGADDLIYSDKISNQVQLLDQNIECGMVYGNMNRINENGSNLGKDYFTWQRFATFAEENPPSGSIFNQLIQENFIPASSVLIRKSVIEEVGGYDSKLKSEDWDLWLRIAKRYKVIGVNELFGAYRILPTSAMHSSRNKIHVLESLNEALVKHQGISKGIDTVIKRHLYKNTIEMYRLGRISKRWANNLYTYKTGIKPLVYYLLMTFGIMVNQKR